MQKYIELYKKLYEEVYSSKQKKYKETSLSNFVAMRGSRYNEKLDKNNVVRFMVVGRAVNGWGKSIGIESADTYAKAAAELFKQENRFQIEWNIKNGPNGPYSQYEELKEDGTPKLNELGEKITKNYSLSKSPFWSTALDIYQALSKNECSKHKDIYEDIVWNNIYKIAPLKEGNPSTNLIYAQAEICVKLLQEEIRLLKPTHILLVIDKSWISWTSRNKVMFDFMRAFEGCQYDRHTIPENADTSIVQCAFTVKDCKVLVTCRPETISRERYKEAVISAFEALPN